MVLSVTCKFLWSSGGVECGFTGCGGRSAEPAFIIGAATLFCLYFSSYNDFVCILWQPFLLLILKENDISYTSRSVRGPALHSSNSPFLLLLGSNQKLSFYLVMFASSTSFVLDLCSPILLLPLSCSIQFEFHPQHFLPRVGLPPRRLPACGFCVFTGHTTPTLGPQGGLCVLTHRRILQRPLVSAVLPWAPWWTGVLLSGLSGLVFLLLRCW